MQGKSSPSTSSFFGHHGAENANLHLASLNDTEPQRLHDVNKDLWQRTFLSVMADEHDQSPTLDLSFSLHDNSFPTLDSGSLLKPQQAQVFPNSDTPNHYNSASPPEPASVRAPSSKANPIRTPHQPKSKALDNAAVDLSRALIVTLIPPIVNTTSIDTERRGTEKDGTAIKGT
ncbi:hypothetical protein FAGAP_12 [Fusarium agapanthi]|uniref:Uncharacterized protein n=1 Tax=Fusarium agapanthi TaxID=1803897 RepID=A0A9P5EHE9_9HYPO|nr:hypothetical protein FAGAP_12 [Fusarium agapanthi]